MQSKTMTSKIGLVVFGIGAALMAGMGFLSSWWFVPAIREVGFDNLAVPGAVAFLWGISAPLGAVLVAIGGALYAQAERRLTVPLIVGSLVVIALTAAWPIREPIPPLFGISGGLITLLFLGLLWNWAKSRPTLSGAERLGSDLGMVGHVFYLFAAWYLCGLLGAPTFTLRPELMEKYDTVSNAASLGSLIAVYLVLGWAFTFFGQRMALRAKS
jgi:hypothetical protein